MILVSENFNLIKQDLIKVGIGLILAILGAIATFLEVDLLKLIDFSTLGTTWQLPVYIIISGLNAGIINLIRKYINQTTYYIENNDIKNVEQCCKQIEEENIEKNDEKLN